MSQQINLFNPIFLKQRKYFSAIAMLQALGLIILGAGSLALYWGYQFTSVQNAESATAARLIVARKELTKINADFAPREKNLVLADSVAKAELEVRTLQQVFGTLKKGDIGNTDGYSAYLLAFSRQIVDGLWITGFSIIGAGNELDLRGRALRPEMVPSYINRLKSETIMQGKTFSSLEMLVPQTVLANNQAQANPSLPIFAPYIDFDLRSSGIVKDKNTFDSYTPPSLSVLPSNQALANSVTSTSHGEKAQ